MNRAPVLGVVIGGTTMCLMDILVDNIGLSHHLSELTISELVSCTAELGHAPDHAHAVVQALYESKVSRAANTISYPFFFMLSTAVWVAVTLPGLFLPHGRTYRREAV
ncbi:MAG: hypothetical protein IID61_15105 [SAR324 cluster bacterium]|nr:hypothetical protein [SAR324 cluster bacterium]